MTRPVWCVASLTTTTGSWGSGHRVHRMEHPLALVPADVPAWNSTRPATKLPPPWNRPRWQNYVSAARPADRDERPTGGRRHPRLRRCPRFDLRRRRSPAPAPPGGARTSLNRATRSTGPSLRGRRRTRDRATPSPLPATVSSISQSRADEVHASSTDRRNPLGPATDGADPSGCAGLHEAGSITASPDRGGGEKGLQSRRLLGACHRISTRAGSAMSMTGNHLLREGAAVW